MMRGRVALFDEPVEVCASDPHPATDMNGGEPPSIDPVADGLLAEPEDLGDLSHCHERLARGGGRRRTLLLHGFSHWAEETPFRKSVLSRCVQISHRALGESRKAGVALAARSGKVGDAPREHPETERELMRNLDISRTRYKADRARIKSQRVLVKLRLGARLEREAQTDTVPSCSGRCGREPAAALEGGAVNLIFPT